MSAPVELTYTHGQVHVRLTVEHADSAMANAVALSLANVLCASGNPQMYVLGATPDDIHEVKTWEAST